MSLTPSVETLFDISFCMGYAWNALSGECRVRIMDDLIDGSRSLAEMAACWAEEFDVIFAKKLILAPDTDSYLEDVDKFFHDKWSEFMARQLAQRMTQ
jgi:hypothetical protein